MRVTGVARERFGELAAAGVERRLEAFGPRGELVGDEPDGAIERPGDARGAALDEGRDALADIGEVRMQRLAMDRDGLVELEARRLEPPRRSSPRFAMVSAAMRVTLSSSSRTELARVTSCSTRSLPEEAICARSSPLRRTMTSVIPAPVAASWSRTVPPCVASSLTSTAPVAVISSRSSLP